LTVSIASSWLAPGGPGPALKTAFEQECGCQVNYVPLDEGPALLSRVLEDRSTPTDAVVGLELGLLGLAAGSGLFAPHERELAALRLPIAWSDPLFVPVGYSFLAVLYDRKRVPRPPASLHELITGHPEQKLLIADPRTSTTGLGMVLWLRHVYGDGAGPAWRRLQRRVAGVSRGSGEALAAFLKGEAPLLLGSNLFPVGQRPAKPEPRFAVALFAEGQYLQVVTAGRLAAARQPELAGRWLAFLLSPVAQQTIATSLGLYPVITPATGAAAAGQVPPLPGKLLLFPPEAVAVGWQHWLGEWLEVFNR
jgi:thiamine transport system substrate-binding protein